MVAIIVLEAELKPIAEQMAVQVFPERNGYLMCIPLCQTNGGPVTHWATKPIVSDAVLAQVEQMQYAPAFAGRCWLRTAEVGNDTAAFFALLTELGLHLITPAE